MKVSITQGEAVLLFGTHELWTGRIDTNLPNVHIARTTLDTTLDAWANGAYIYLADYDVTNLQRDLTVTIRTPIATVTVEVTE